MRSKVWAATICVVLSALLFGSCLEDAGEKAATRVAAAIDRAVSQVTSESGKWREKVTQLEDDLAKDTDKIAQDALREVKQIAARTIATAGTELRCDVDFIGKRVSIELSNLARRIRKQPTVAVSPGICQVVPTHIDRRVPPDKEAVLEIYGYDFPTDGKGLTVVVRDATLAENDVTAKALHIPTHYLATLNLSGTGIHNDLTPNSRAVSLKWESAVISTVAVVDSQPDIHVETFTAASDRVNHPRAVARVDRDYVLIGGGCRADYVGAGQLLVASYPDGDGWVCQSKDHKVADPSSVTAFALGIPKAEGLIVTVSKNTSPVVPHPHATADVPTGQDLVGGGCLTSWENPQPGNMLVDSFPTSGKWNCEAKDHGGDNSPASVTAYALSIPKTSRFQTVLFDAVSDIAGHPSAAARIDERRSPRARLVGGGCDVSYAGVGSLLSASFPNGASWECRAKDHGQPDPGKVQAYAIGLQSRGR